MTHQDLVNMTAAIQRMARKGYIFELGHHTNNARGYYAQFFHRDEYPERSWAGVGHGLSVSDAVLMAEKIANKEKVSIPSSSMFGCDTPEEDYEDGDEDDLPVIT